MKIISFILLIFITTSCQPKDKFDWNAGWSAPKYYGSAPMVEYFYKGKSIAGTSANIGADSGWGTTSGGYVGGDKFKDVPDSVFVKYISSPDGYSYEGGYRLPREKMLSLFKEGIRDSLNKKNNYTVIVTGMAPGGNVKLWLKGGRISKELVRFKAVNKGIWEESNKDYQKFRNKINSSEDFKNSEANIFRNLHGVPYKVWEVGEKEYNFNIGIVSDNDFNNYTSQLSKDGSYIFLNERESTISTKDWLSNNIKLKSKVGKLPVNFSVQWASKDQQQWYEGEIILPNNFESDFNIFLESNPSVNIVLVIDKINPSEDFVYGILYLQSYKNKQKIMKFRLSKLDVISREFYVSKYSLPKGFVFPKWEGREPISLPENFQYYQEK